ncbi:MAG: hypothetical protein KAT00_05240, partial [Planctomycetes bacterium]|nr:hypothetical protein [Planctomycetota bacterium]
MADGTQPTLIFDFIDQHRWLYDGYQVWGNVGLVYSHLGHRHDVATIRDAIGTLVAENVPFKIRIAGSDWWDPGPLDVSGLNGLVKTGDYQYLTASQKNTLDSSSKAVDVSNVAGLWYRMDRPIDVAGGVTNTQVSVVPRKNSAGGKVFHLVNMDTETHNNFTVTISTEFAGVIDLATLYAPNRTPVALTVSNSAAANTLEIPILEEYGVIMITNDTSDVTAPAAPTGLIAAAGIESVSLNWADNIEPDLAGYRVYRSTTSGSGYTLVASGVDLSQFIDTGLAGDTTYYHVITAGDSHNNESPVSNEAYATTPVTHSSTINISEYQTVDENGMAPATGDENVFRFTHDPVDDQPPYTTDLYLRANVY